MDAVVTTPPVVTGTTLEKCAPYFAHGLEVEVINDDIPGAVYRVVGWQDDELLICPYTDLSDAFTINPKHCRMRLKPFSALCDQLPDGTVPAVEVARLYGLEGEVGKIQTRPDFYMIPQAGDPALAACFILKRSAFETGSFSLAVMRKLWELHFAVGLAPHEFVPKLD